MPKVSLCDQPLPLFMASSMAQDMGTLSENFMFHPTQSTRQAMSWQPWVTPQALQNLSQKKSIFLYLNQAYQCMQLFLFDSLLMIQTPKNTWSSPTKKQNPKCNQDSLHICSPSSRNFIVSLWQQVSFCLNSQLLQGGCRIIKPYQ